MLIHVAIGDAYGAGFEYADPTDDRPNDCDHYELHPSHGLARGQYTDDTQMSIANAEVILSGKPLKKDTFGHAYLECFKRDWRDGYARRFQAFLEEVKTGEEFMRRIRPDSDKSGAAMRASVIGLFPTIEQVKEVAVVQARVTHDTEGGRNSAQAAALACHYFVYQLGPKDNLGLFLEKEVPGRDWNREWTNRVGSKGMDSTHAAISAIQRGDSMRGILYRCVDYTGDVDTVAAVALGAAWASTEVLQDLPNTLKYGLENGKYGREYLATLDQKLFQHFSLERFIEAQE